MFSLFLFIHTFTLQEHIKDAIKFHFDIFTAKYLTHGAVSQKE